MIPFPSQLDKLYRDIFFAVCHPGHLKTPALWYNPFPLCYRETGIFIGFLVGFTLLAETQRHRPSELPRRRIVYLIVGSIVLMAIDGVASYARIYSSNEIRLATGLLVGFAASALVAPAINGAVFRHPSLERVLERRHVLVAWLVAAPVTFALIWFHPLGIGYVMPHLAAVAVVLLIATVNLYGLSMMKVFTRVERSMMEALPWLLASIVFSLVEIAVLAFAHAAMHG